MHAQRARGPPSRRAGAGIRNAPARVSGAAAGVQEQLGPVAAVEVGAAHRDVAAQRLDRRPAERDDPLLRALAERAHDPVVEVDRAPVQAGRLADAQARRRTSARRAHGRASRAASCPLAASISRSASDGRERARQRPGPARQLERGGRVVRARAPSSIWCRKNERTAATRRADGRRSETGGAHLGEPALELLGRRLHDGPRTPRLRAARGRAGRRRPCAAPAASPAARGSLVEIRVGAARHRPGTGSLATPRRILL